MKWANNSIYKKGMLDITIEFPKDFPRKSPEIRIKNNKIYHFQASTKELSNGADEFTMVKFVIILEIIGI